MAFKQKIFLFVAVTLLSACGYAIESSNQEITFETPNAQNAKCFVYVDRLKYVVYPPQLMNIKKSEKDMQVTCSAPGNRRIELTVPSILSGRSVWGGPAGMAWDYASDSLFYYPSVIAVDFSQEKLVPNKLPQHNNSDIRQPESYDLEEFRPGNPRLNSDKNKPLQSLIRRGAEQEEMVEPSDKGDLQSVINGLDQSQHSASTDPTPLYAGE